MGQVGLFNCTVQAGRLLTLKYKQHAVRKVNKFLFCKDRNFLMIIAQSNFGMFFALYKCKTYQRL